MAEQDTGEVRSILCDMCNAGIGSFGEDVNLMLAAIKYLKGHNVGQ